MLGVVMMMLTQSKDYLNTQTLKLDSTVNYHRLKTREAIFHDLNAVCVKNFCFPFHIFYEMNNLYDFLDKEDIELSSIVIVKHYFSRISGELHIYCEYYLSHVVVTEVRMRRNNHITICNITRCRCCRNYNCEFLLDCIDLD